MVHVLVLESSKEKFEEELKKLIFKGFKQVVGSTYIKSVKSGIPISTPSIDFKDISTICTVALEDDYGAYTIVVEEDPDDFYNVVTKFLEDSYKIITGSLYIANIKLTGFDTKVVRCYINWHTCVMYK